MLVKNIAGEKDHIGVQFPDAAVQLRDAPVSYTHLDVYKRQ